MKKNNYLEKLYNSNKTLIIYKVDQGYDIYTDFSEKVILSNKNINSFFNKIKNNRKGHPYIIDACDILNNPKKILSHLCKKLDIPFYQEMLTWKLGHHKTDGFWGEYWYDGVVTTTGMHVGQYGVRRWRVNMHDDNVNLDNTYGNQTGKYYIEPRYLQQGHQDLWLLTSLKNSGSVHR